MRDRLAALVVGLAATIVLSVLAIWAYREAVTDWHYDLAGLSDPFLGRPAPGFTIVIAAFVALVYSVIVLTLRAIARRVVRRGAARQAIASEPATASRSTGVVMRRPRWWWPIGAVIGGYLAGSVLTIAGGGPIEHPGTLRFVFPEPIAGIVDAAARCRSASGQPDVIAEVIPEAAGLPMVSLRNPATGVAGGWGAPPPFWVHLPYLRPAGDEYVLPNVPGRPPMYLLNSTLRMSSGGRQVQKAAIIAVPITFTGAYTYGTENIEESTAAGRITASAVRTVDLYGHVFNELVPNDPWPDRYELGVEWTCDLGRSLEPVPVPARPGIVPAPSTPSSSTSPGPSLAPGGAPAQLRVVTTSDWTTVRISGASVASHVLVGSDGATTDVAVDRRGFVLTQPLSAAKAGRGVAATWAVTLAWSPEATLPDGNAELTVEIDRGSLGATSVTLYNVLGPEPTPVGVAAWPALAAGQDPQCLGSECLSWDTRWLTQPVTFEVVRQ